MAEKKIALKKELLTEAFTFMGNFIQQQNQSVTIVVFGGSVCVMELENRESTEDVDYFAQHIRESNMPAYRVLRGAIEAAEKKFEAEGFRLNWMNDTVQAYNKDKGMSGEYLAVMEAQKQNVVLFKGGMFS
jgi:3,4-dihydroxy-2-butanone 4-phosphate synthase